VFVVTRRLCSKELHDKHLICRHVCEHMINGTNGANSICRTDKSSWRGGSCGIPLCLGDLGEFLLVSSTCFAIYHGHLEWLKCDPADVLEKILIKVQ
jgi:hypothetical protein